MGLEQAVTILIPGITGTNLVDANSINYEMEWTLLKSQVANLQKLRLALNPEHDEDPDVLIRPAGVDLAAYGPILDYLKHKCQQRVYIFAYDWRKSCADNGKLLKHFVEALRLKLQVERFNFVSHSMGGMVFSCFLKELGGDYGLVDHCALCVCPFDGAVDSLHSAVVGMGGIPLPMFNSANAFRAVARTMPAVYELFPVYADALVHHTEGPCSLFDPDYWQSNLQDNAFVQQRLEQLRRFRDPEAPAMLPLSQLPAELKNRILLLIGTDVPTKTQVVIEPQDPSQKVTNFFNFNQPDGVGDGTVPLASAAKYKQDLLTLALSRDGYNLGESLSYHGLFMTDEKVHGLVGKFFAGAALEPDWWRPIGSQRIQRLS